MLLTEHLKLDPMPEQAALLLETMRVSNAASNRVAEIAFERKAFGRTKVHNLTYYLIRDELKLPAETAIRAIAKACKSFKTNKKVKPVFKSLGAIGQDYKTLSWKKNNAISILTIQGRIKVPVIYQGRHRLNPNNIQKKGAELIFRDDNFYLAVFIEVTEPPFIENKEWLGVDLGIVNIAVDSDGEQHSDKGLRVTRKRNIDLRAELQRVGTKSAKQLLKKRSRRESRMARDVNHCISKAIVSKAKGTDQGIKLEDLKGIRDRTTVRKAQRAEHDSWAFAELRTFIEYKGKLSGVRVEAVDPRNTSRECPKCHYISKNNRRSQEHFECRKCGFAAPADYVGAINISNRVPITVPNAGPIHQPDE